MLVLSRHTGESIIVPLTRQTMEALLADPAFDRTEIEVAIVNVGGGDRVKVGITADPIIPVMRSELLETA